jgi:RNA polymerase sigma-70 factor (ECF subfamily)
MNFESLYTAYSPKIFRVCLGYFNDADLAKDITQETFVTVFENLDRLKHTDNVSGWIYKIATNKCLRQLENKKREDRISPDFLTEDKETDQEEIRSSKLHQAISELPELERIIIGLYLEDLSQEKIAEIVGISYANLRVKLHRIKEVLSNKMQKHEG